MVRNPYGGRDYRVSLAPDDVDGFIFWTRNLKPFRQALDSAHKIAPFVIQYTITGYPDVLERGTPPANHAIAEIQRVHNSFGPGHVVWRYDPVIWTAATDTAWHLSNFNKLAGQLEGLVDEVTFSAATLYAKSRRNLKRHAPDLAVFDPPQAEKTALLQQLAAFSRARGMQPTLCSQPDLLTSEMAPASCVDAQRLQRLGGHIFKSKLKGNRPGCACAESRDIGHYDSCAHGCFYCYAVRDHDRVQVKHA